MLKIFGLMAKHGYRLSFAAEDRISDALPILAVQMPEGPFLWNCLREVLLGPWAAHALRTMHALGILELIIPEFHGIESLVIRDTWHRYTVDEHTFHVIDNVHRLRQPQNEWEKRLASLLPEIDRLDLFFLALLMHDTGKARRSGQSRHQQRGAEREPVFAPRTRRGRTRDRAPRHSQSSGNVSGDAARYFRHGNGSRLCGEGRDPAAAEDAHADDLCRYPRGFAGGADPVESREPVAALHERIEFPRSQRR